MRIRHVLIGVALCAAAGLVLFRDKSTKMEVVDGDAQQPTAPFVRARLVAGTQQSETIIRLRPRTTMTSEEAISEADAAPFSSRSWTPPPTPTPPAAPPPPPPPPSAPALPFIVIGMALDDGRREVYLMRNAQTLTVSDGDVIDGAWRVESIRPPIMTLVYLPLGQSKLLNIGVFE
jgi:hypothetical protein